LYKDKLMVYFIYKAYEEKVFMNQRQIEVLLKQLDWNNDDEIRYEAITKLHDVEDLSLFLRPKKYGEEIWDGCAKVLTFYRNDLLPYLDELFEWLDDENNPGFFDIHSRLNYTYDEVKDSYLKNIQKAKESNDNKWLDILLNMHFRYVNEIEKEIRKLSWDEPRKVQLDTIEKLSKVKDLTYFLQKSGKDTWENCARILLNKTDEQLTPYLKEMFEWLQDMNWPGFYIIKYRLEKFHINKIQSIYEACLQNAKRNIDVYEIWYEVLKNMHFRNKN